MQPSNIIFFQSNDNACNTEAYSEVPEDNIFF